MASTTMPTSNRFWMSSPGFGSPTPENRLQVAKDASPATSTFPGVRSPLDSIGTNAGGSTFGLRQRRQGADGGEVLNANEKMKAPPRASLTMSMASKASNTIPSSSGKNSAARPAVDPISFRETWVLIFGFSTEEQCEEAYGLFKQIGRVEESKVNLVSSSRNWIALKYEDALTVEKARCRHPLILSDGCICGVQHLENSRAFFLKQQNTYSHSTNRRKDKLGGKEESAAISRGLFPPEKESPATATENTTINELEEEDVLIVNKARETTDRKSICQALMAWIYGW